MILCWNGGLRAAILFGPHRSGGRRRLADTENRNLQINRIIKARKALAARLEAGATALAAFVAPLSETEWQTRVPIDGRKIGVVVHHVASVYPIELHLAHTLAAGQPITAVTWDACPSGESSHPFGSDATHSFGRTLTRGG
ncbi:MAG: hypothetical protein JJE04_15880 [Acidobacteriia bacterium]|nr:hypothetical protein [Terriglobia bacterium]